MSETQELHSIRLWPLYIIAAAVVIALLAIWLPESLNRQMQVVPTRDFYARRPILPALAALALTLGLGPAHALFRRGRTRHRALHRFISLQGTQR